MRILWVVPRYGRGIAGGAETLVRALATRCAAEGWTAEVATTCARDHVTWADELPAGTVGRGRRRRAPLPGRARATGARYERPARGDPRPAAPATPTSSSGSRNSVWSPGMQEFLEDETGHDLRVLSPYLFGTTLWGAQAAPERSALLPCLHDEPYARLTHRAARAWAPCAGASSTPPPRSAWPGASRPVRDGGVVGMGFDPPAGPPPAAARGRRGTSAPTSSTPGASRRASACTVGGGPRGAPAAPSARTGPRWC